VRRCDDSTESDYVELSDYPLESAAVGASQQQPDAASSESSDAGELRQPRRLPKPELGDSSRFQGGAAGDGVRRLCGDIAVPKVVQSTSSFFRVSFRSNDVYDQTGFSAGFEFVSTSSSTERLTHGNDVSRGKEASFSTPCAFTDGEPSGIRRAPRRGAHLVPLPILNLPTRSFATAKLWHLFNMFEKLAYGAQETRPRSCSYVVHQASPRAVQKKSDRKRTTNLVLLRKS
jgi:hypothetical protein